MNVIGNYSLINDAKCDPYTCLERGTYSLFNDAKCDPYICLERGTYPAYHDVIHFTRFLISKSDIFGPKNATF